MLVIDEAQAITIGKTGDTGYIETVAADFLDLAYKLTDCLRSIETGDVRLASFQEIVCKTTIKRLLQIGFEFISWTSKRRTCILLGMFPADFIKALAIG